MTRRNPDLYAALGIGRGASADQIRKAYSWCMSTESSAERRAAVQQAYAVLGDPRLRSEYDRGQVVGVGVGSYFESRAASPRTSRRKARRSAGLETRWHRRSDARALCEPPRVLRAFAIAVTVASVLGVAGNAGASWWRTAKAGANVNAQSAAVQPPPAGAVQLRPRAVPQRHTSPAPAPRPAARPVHTGFATGSCYSPGPALVMRSDQPIPCARPHLNEVVKVVDLIRLQGGPVGDSAAQKMGTDVCDAEFRDFTGLAVPTSDLWVSIFTTTGGSPPVATATCVVTSRHPRTGSARSIAR